MKNRERIDHSNPTASVSKRRNRIPLNRPRNILTVPQEYHSPEFHLEFVAHDEDKWAGNIQKYLDAGFEFVTGGVEVGESTVERPSSTNLDGYVTRNGGRGVTLFLMRQPMDWYLEDQESVQNDINAIESAIRPNEQEGQYGTGAIIESQMVKGRVRS